jgi:hypothetical protein
MRQQKLRSNAKPKEVKLDLTYKQGLFLQSTADEVLFGG